MEQRKYEVTEAMLLTDLGLLADGIFEAEITEAEGALVFAFTNGQKFRVVAEQIS